jgi:ribosomal protein S18 acetylase RimI-like enzyme
MNASPPSPTTVEVRRVRSDEWSQLRELRLEALKDTPIAFAEAYDEAVAQPDSFWQERAARGAMSDSARTFVAVRGARFVGMTVVLVDGDAADLVGVYVTPALRGRAHGVADALFAAAVGWCREDAGVARVRLNVTEGNDRAAAFYRRLGFVPNGVTVPYPLDPDIREIQMELPGPLSTG